MAKDKRKALGATPVTTSAPNLRTKPKHSKKKRMTMAYVPAVLRASMGGNRAKSETVRFMDQAVDVNLGTAIDYRFILKIIPVAQPGQLLFSDFEFDVYYLPLVARRGELWKRFQKNVDSSFLAQETYLLSLDYYDKEGEFQEAGLVNAKYHLMRYDKNHERASSEPEAPGRAYLSNKKVLECRVYDKGEMTLRLLFDPQKQRWDKCERGRDYEKDKDWLNTWTTKRLRQEQATAAAVAMPKDRLAPPLSSETDETTALLISVPVPQRTAVTPLTELFREEMAEVSPDSSSASFSLNSSEASDNTEEDYFEKGPDSDYDDVALTTEYGDSAEEDKHDETLEPAAVVEEAMMPQVWKRPKGVGLVRARKYSLKLRHQNTAEPARPRAHSEVSACSSSKEDSEPKTPKRHSTGSTIGSVKTLAEPKEELPPILMSSPPRLSVRDEEKEEASALLAQLQQYRFHDQLAAVDMQARQLQAQLQRLKLLSHAKVWHIDSLRARYRDIYHQLKSINELLAQDSNEAVVVFYEQSQRVQAVVDEIAKQLENFCQEQQDKALDLVDTEYSLRAAPTVKKWQPRLNETKQKDKYRKTLRSDHINYNVEPCKHDCNRMLAIVKAMYDAVNNYDPANGPIRLDKGNDESVKIAMMVIKALQLPTRYGKKPDKLIIDVRESAPTINASTLFENTRLQDFYTRKYPIPSGIGVLSRSRPPLINERTEDRCLYERVKECVCQLNLREEVMEYTALKPQHGVFFTPMTNVDYEEIKDNIRDITKASHYLTLKA